MMARLRLSTLLVGTNLVLVLVAVVIVGLAAGWRLERLADEQALARVALAGASATRSLEAEGEDLTVSTRLLAERPTLARLVRKGDAAALAGYLETFRRTGELSGCAVLRQGAPVAAAGKPLPWAELVGQDIAPSADDDAEDRPASRIVLGPAGELLLVAAAPLPGEPATLAAGGVALDQTLTSRLSERSGLTLRILSAREILHQGSDPRAPLRERVRLEGLPRQEELEEARAYLDVRPLGAAGLGVIEAELSTDSVRASLRGLERGLIVLALVTMAGAIAGSVVLARWLSRPLEGLTAAARRIGGGDLATPVPPASGAEMGALAASMEEMRGRLAGLNSELSRRRVEAEAVLGGIVEGVFAVDAERQIRYLNPQLAELLGVRPEDALGHFCGDVLRPRPTASERPCERNCPIVHARFRGSASATEHLQLADGRLRTVVITSANAEVGAAAAPGEARQFQVLRDETEIEAGRRLRDSLLANISHEFRTPLSAQLASIELLREKLPDLPPGEALELVSSLERGALRLTQLIDNLLESVRIEAGHDELRRAPVALDEVVEEAVELTSPLLAQRRQRLEIALPFPLPAISGDTPRLTQVFVNLLANAGKYAPPGTLIRVGGAEVPEGLSLWVEDEGPGLPEESRDSVFERFVRARPESGREEPDAGGMGLGLSIVKSIVERHGGRVAARGRPDGARGTRFIVTLPREAA